MLPNPSKPLRDAVPPQRAVSSLSRSVQTACLALSLVLVATSWLAAQYTHPTAKYIFPAGGQRGTTVEFKVGGQFFLGGAAFRMSENGVLASSTVKEVETTWFEGPLVTKPLSLKEDDYPIDHAGQVTIDVDAETGDRYWQVWTSQGATPARVFVVGELPEVVEAEIDGAPIPQAIALPVTINGRIFPREDLDIWTFEAEAGTSYRLELYAARLGSKLEARLVLLDPRKRLIGEETARSGVDPVLSFTAAESGIHEVQLHDIQYGGRQDYVYRLTVERGAYVKWSYPLGGQRGTEVAFQLGVERPSAAAVTFAVMVPKDAPSDWSHRFKVDGILSNRMLFQTGDVTEHFEDESREIQLESSPALGSTTLNGRIGIPGDIDLWAFQAVQEQTVVLDLQAAQLGSPLDSVMTVIGSDGRELGHVDDSDGHTDSRLEFSVPEDGVYQVRVAERFRSRGGPAYAYRLHLHSQVPASYTLTLAQGALTLTRGAKVSLGVTALREGPHAEPIQLVVEGLPFGVSAEPAVIPPDKNSASITLAASPQAAIRGSTLRVRGHSGVDGARVVRTAKRPGRRGERADEEILLAVALPTPFKIHRTGLYYTRAARGCTTTAPFRIERGGYEGPLTIRLGERQRRHLQGITSEPMIVPTGATTFDYTVQLVPRMEVSRTSRVLIVGVGEIEEPDGRKHRVAFSGTESPQLVLMTTAGRLSVQLDRPSVSLAPGGRATLNARVVRGRGLDSAVQLELVLPTHIKGVRAEPVELAPSAKGGEIVLQADELAGPFNMPLKVRATAHDAAGHPIYGETEIDIFWSPQGIPAVATGKATP
jgi:hypothetical protein